LIRQILFSTLFPLTRQTRRRRRRRRRKVYSELTQ